MKKFISLLLVVLILLLSGCSRIPDAYGGPPLSGDAQSAVQNRLVEACLGGFSYHDYDKYLKFVKSVEWPYGFVEWDDLSYLDATKWDGFGLTSPDETPDGTSYWYGFVDGNGAELIVYIDHTLEDDKGASVAEYQEAFITDEMTSMRQYVAKERVIIKRSGVEYKYSNEELLSITWIHNGVKYSISDNTLREYPKDAKNIFMARLLSLDDAEFKLALAEINPDPMTN